MNTLFSWWKKIGKFGKKLYFLDILAFEPGKLCLGVGFCFIFFNPVARVLHWKAVPGAGILTKNIIGQGVSWGGGDSNRSNWYLHYFYPASPWDDSRSCRHPCCAKVSPPENLCVLLVNWDKPEISSSLHLLGSVRNVFWSGLTSQGKKASISFRFLSVPLLHIHQLILLGKS